MTPRSSYMVCMSTVQAWPHDSTEFLHRLYEHRTCLATWLHGVLTWFVWAPYRLGHDSTEFLHVLYEHRTCLATWLHGVLTWFVWTPYMLGHTTPRSSYVVCMNTVHAWPHDSTEFLHRLYEHRTGLATWLHGGLTWFVWAPYRLGHDSTEFLHGLYEHRTCLATWLHGVLTSFVWTPYRLGHTTPRSSYMVCMNTVQAWPHDSTEFLHRLYEHRTGLATTLRSSYMVCMNTVQAWPHDSTEFLHGLYEHRTGLATWLHGVLTWFVWTPYRLGHTTPRSFYIVCMNTVQAWPHESTEFLHRLYEHRTGLATWLHGGLTWFVWAPYVLGHMTPRSSYIVCMNTVQAWPHDSTEFLHGLYEHRTGLATRLHGVLTWFVWTPYRLGHMTPRSSYMVCLNTVQAWPHDSTEFLHGLYEHRTCLATRLHGVLTSFVWTPYMLGHTTPRSSYIVCMNTVQAWPHDSTEFLHRLYEHRTGLATWLHGVLTSFVWTPYRLGHMTPRRSYMVCMSTVQAWPRLHGVLTWFVWTPYVLGHMTPRSSYIVCMNTVQAWPHDSTEFLHGLYEHRTGLATWLHGVLTSFVWTPYRLGHDSTEFLHGLYEHRTGLATRLHGVLTWFVWTPYRLGHMTPRSSYMVCMNTVQAWPHDSTEFLHRLYEHHTGLATWILGVLTSFVWTPYRLGHMTPRRSYMVCMSTVRAWPHDSMEFLHRLYEHRTGLATRLHGVLTWFVWTPYRLGHMTPRSSYIVCMNTVQAWPHDSTEVLHGLYEHRTGLATTPRSSYMVCMNTVRAWPHDSTEFLHRLYEHRTGLATRLHGVLTWFVWTPYRLGHMTPRSSYIVCMNTVQAWPRLYGVLTWFVWTPYRLGHTPPRSSYMVCMNTVQAWPHDSTEFLHGLYEHRTGLATRLHGVFTSFVWTPYRLGHMNPRSSYIVCMNTVQAWPHDSTEVLHGLYEHRTCLATWLHGVLTSFVWTPYRLGHTTPRSSYMVCMNTVQAWPHDSTEFLHRLYEHRTGLATTLRSSYMVCMNTVQAWPHDSTEVLHGLYEHSTGLATTLRSSYMVCMNTVQAWPHDSTEFLHGLYEHRTGLATWLHGVLTWFVWTPYRLGHMTPRSSYMVCMNTVQAWPRFHWVLTSFVWTPYRLGHTTPRSSYIVCMNSVHAWPRLHGVLTSFVWKPNMLGHTTPRSSHIVCMNTVQAWPHYSMELLHRLYEHRTGLATTPRSFYIVCMNTVQAWPRLHGVLTSFVWTPYRLGHTTPRSSYIVCMNTVQAWPHDSTEFLHRLYEHRTGLATLLHGVLTSFVWTPYMLGHMTPRSSYMVCMNTVHAWPHDSTEFLRRLYEHRTCLATRLHGVLTSFVWTPYRLGHTTPRSFYIVCMNTVQAWPHDSTEFLHRLYEHRTGLATWLHGGLTWFVWAPYRLGHDSTEFLHGLYEHRTCLATWLHGVLTSFVWTTYRLGHDSTEFLHGLYEHRTGLATRLHGVLIWFVWTPYRLGHMTPRSSYMVCMNTVQAWPHDSTEFLHRLYEHRTGLATWLHGVLTSFVWTPYRLGHMTPRRSYMVCMSTVRAWPHDSTEFLHRLYEHRTGLATRLHGVLTWFVWTPYRLGHMTPRSSYIVCMNTVQAWPRLYGVLTWLVWTPYRLGHTTPWSSYMVCMNTVQAWPHDSTEFLHGLYEHRTGLATWLHGVLTWFVWTPYKLGHDSIEFLHRLYEHRTGLATRLHGVLTSFVWTPYTLGHDSTEFLHRLYENRTCLATRLHGVLTSFVWTPYRLGHTTPWSSYIVCMNTVQAWPRLHGVLTSFVWTPYRLGHDSTEFLHRLYEHHTGLATRLHGVLTSFVWTPYRLGHTTPRSFYIVCMNTVQAWPHYSMEFLHRLYEHRTGLATRLHGVLTSFVWTPYRLGHTTPQSFYIVCMNTVHAWPHYSMEFLHRLYENRTCLATRLHGVLTSFVWTPYRLGHTTPWSSYMVCMNTVQAWPHDSTEFSHRLYEHHTGLATRLHGVLTSFVWTPYRLGHTTPWSSYIVCMNTVQAWPRLHGVLTSFVWTPYRLGHDSTEFLHRLYEHRTGLATRLHGVLTSFVWTPYMLGHTTPRSSHIVCMKTVHAWPHDSTEFSHRLYEHHTGLATLLHGVLTSFVWTPYRLGHDSTEFLHRLYEHHTCLATRLHGVLTSFVWTPYRLGHTTPWSSYIVCMNTVQAWPRLHGVLTSFVWTPYRLGHDSTEFLHRLYENRTCLATRLHGVLTSFVWTPYRLGHTTPWSSYIVCMNTVQAWPRLHGVLTSFVWTPYRLGHDSTEFLHRLYEHHTGLATRLHGVLTSFVWTPYRLGHTTPRSFYIVCMNTVQAWPHYSMEFLHRLYEHRTGLATRLHGVLTSFVWTPYRLGHTTPQSFYIVCMNTVHAWPHYSMEFLHRLYENRTCLATRLHGVLTSFVWTPYRLGHTTPWSSYMVCMNTVQAWPHDSTEFSHRLYEHHTGLATRLHGVLTSFVWTPYRLGHTTPWSSYIVCMNTVQAWPRLHGVLTSFVWTPYRLGHDSTEFLHRLYEHRTGLATRLHGVLTSFVWTPYMLGHTTPRSSHIVCMKTVHAWPHDSTEFSHRLYEHHTGLATLLHGVLTSFVWTPYRLGHDSTEFLHRLYEHHTCLATRLHGVLTSFVWTPYRLGHTTPWSSYIVCMNTVQAWPRLHGVLTSFVWTPYRLGHDSTEFLHRLYEHRTGLATRLHGVLTSFVWTPYRLGHKTPRSSYIVCMNTVQAWPHDSTKFLHRLYVHTQCSKQSNGVECVGVSMLMCTIKNPWSHSLRLRVFFCRNIYCHDCAESCIIIHSPAHYQRCPPPYMTLPSKQEILTQCWLIVGPPSATLAQH